LGKNGGFWIAIMLNQEEALENKAMASQEYSIGSMPSPTGDIPVFAGPLKRSSH